MNIYKILIPLFLCFLIENNALAAPNDIRITVSENLIQFQLINPNGLITGYDQTKNTRIEQIPNLKYKYNSDDTERKGHIIESENTSATNEITPGKYKLKIFGSAKIESYSLDIMAPFIYSNYFLEYSSKSIIYPNSIWVYEFNIPNMPEWDKNFHNYNNEEEIHNPSWHKEIILIKISTPSELINDIQEASKLGYIGNQQYINDIITKISQTNLLKSGQKEKYKDILNELTQIYNKPDKDKYIKNEGYLVFKEDLNYIIKSAQ